MKNINNYIHFGMNPDINKLALYLKKYNIVTTNNADFIKVRDSTNNGNVNGIINELNKNSNKYKLYIRKIGGKIIKCIYDTSVIPIDKLVNVTELMKYINPGEKIHFDSEKMSKEQQNISLNDIQKYLKKYHIITEYTLKGPLEDDGGIKKRLIPIKNFLSNCVVYGSSDYGMDDVIYFLYDSLTLKEKVARKLSDRIMEYHCCYTTHDDKINKEFRFYF